LCSSFARPAAESKPSACGLFVLLLLLVLYLFYTFNDSCQADYLIIYWIDLRHLFRIGRNVIVDNQPEISFSIPKGRCHGDQLLSTKLIFSDIRWMALAYGKSSWRSRAG